MLQLFGIMGYLKIPFNPANMISLPLMLGMGVDNGINIVYDFRRQTDKYRMSPSTAVAVILNTLTTMVGFAVLMIADHRGLQSLGRVLTIGMSCCLVSSLIILPAFLAWITRNRREEDQEMPEPATREQIAVEEEQIAYKRPVAPAFQGEFQDAYPHAVAGVDQSRPLAEIWRQDSSHPDEEHEGDNKEEILRFTPPSPPDGRQEWLQKRSA